MGKLKQGASSSFDKKIMVKAIDRAISSLVSWQNASQKVLITIAPYLFDGSTDAEEVFEHFLNKLDKYDDRFKMEKSHLELYAVEVMGLAVSFNKEDQTNTVTSEKVDVVTARKRLDKMKETAWYKYRNKLLKPVKINHNIFTQMARGYAAGNITQQDIESEYGEFGWAKVETHLMDDKVLDWAEKFQRQEGVQ